MIQFKAASTTLAFISLLTFQIVTPAYFLPPDAEIVTDYQGHTTEHSAPYLFCESGGSRDYTLIISEVRWEVAPGQFFTAWTFNSAIPGPTLCGYEGETLQIEIMNHLDRSVEFSVAPAGGIAAEGRRLGAWAGVIPTLVMLGGLFAISTAADRTAVPASLPSVGVSQQAYAGNKRLQPGTGVVGIAVRVKVY